MKNVTLAVEEDVLAAARKYAAARKTTVNGLVRDYLRQTCGASGSGRAGEKGIGRTGEVLHLRSRRGLEVEQGGVV